MKGLLLINLGSPDSTSISDVKKYLDEFLMDKRVIGKRNNPFKNIIPITDKIKIDKIIELDLPDLNDKSGNFIKGIGLTISMLIAATNIKAVLGSP